MTDLNTRTPVRVRAPLFLVELHLPESLQFGLSLHLKFPLGATRSNPVTRSKGQPKNSPFPGPSGSCIGAPQLAEMVGGRDGGRAVLSLP